MSITMGQGILIAIWAMIAGLDCWLQAFFIFRPIIVCTITGLILGDLQLGVIAGGLTELAFAGLTPAGGTQPPNTVLCGIMTVVIAKANGTAPATAIGLSLPFAMLMQYILLLFYSSFSLFMSKFDKYAAEGNAKAFKRLNFVPLTIVTLSFGIVAFLSAYAAQGPMHTLVTSMPQWLTHGFEIAGGILPAVGFAMLLKVMLKPQYFPYLLLGFVMSSMIPFSNVLPVALVGAVFAMIEYFRTSETNELRTEIKGLKDSSNSGGGYNDGI
ncbi:PTS system, N-acetylgalactosamine-specific IIC component [Pediococcus damnosus]|uniref:PTS system, N-acetylgalactosamine-specific IIC component n=2 Tax=Pediococcus damnosus TaxID=51663 RepID=A0ABM6A2L4_9LACO|nr:PTS galactosamine transporter subunit IIC [Pediococcus damnosus]AMV60987.1 PTS system, N-acetylgalactosamine-specific IIC component [Pediococcus damnosus]AMV65347.1 PTS system, N-acetylgalactosamine-specific IIC component [Pediococcus damnosus]AMV66504.1 PTS system, N-acetylgalactosamine-specific IIC component [Pediococcus damnosus]KJU73456.1 PTS sucrose transporter subunit IIBC [Pediococcus damnosus LMG 28219]PIO80599.1 PTS sucrose transporter subunit IIBC [Pediococcus damnosus]